MSTEEETENHIGRALTIALVAIGVGAMVYLMVGAFRDPVDATPAARRWADALGMRVTGINCIGSRCAFAPENGAPFVAHCGENGCTLEVCQ